MKIISILILYSTALISCSTNSSTKEKSEVNAEKGPHLGAENSANLPLLDLKDTTRYKLIELNSVNTHGLTNEEVKAEKRKIYSLEPSSKHFDWDNPTSGGAIHINSNDELEVYNCAFIFASTMVSRKVSIDSLWNFVQGFTWGNSPSVLVTSEINPQKSKSMKLVIEELFKHHPRIFYIEKTVANIK